jgi:hypothetical protein
MADLHIEGTVRRGGEPVEGAYITLNSGDTFIAERRTGPDGTYEFNTTDGSGVLICRMSGRDAVQREVSSEGGALQADFDL